MNAENAFYLFNNNIAGTWYVQNAILAAGLSLRWLRDLLKLDNYEHLSQQAQQVPAGADGLVFLPHLAGVRDPNAGATVSGGFYGLRLHHNEAHLARAVMEGVAFAMKECLVQVPHQANRFVLSGGIIESPTWCQILADVLDVALNARQNQALMGVSGQQYLGALVRVNMIASRTDFRGCTTFNTQRTRQHSLQGIPSHTRAISGCVSLRLMG